MAKLSVDRLVPDELWALVAPLLPPAPRYGRRRVVPDRNCFAALVFMCRTSTPWALLPANELGCGSATTAWRRLEEWERAGVFDRLSLVLLDRLGEAGRIDLDRVSVDSASLRALKGGRTPAPTRRPRQARHQAAPGRRQRRRRAAGGAADRGEPPRRGAAGGSAGRPARDPHANRSPAVPAGQAVWRQSLRLARQPPGAARPWDRGADRQARGGVLAAAWAGAWKAERTIAWLFGCRRLRLRYERSDARFYAFVLLACSLLSFHVLQQPP